MAALSDLIKRLPPWTVVLSFSAVVMAGVFNLGAASVTVRGYPKQTVENTATLVVHETSIAVHDTSIANMVLRQTAQHDEFQSNFERAFCFLRLLVADERPIPAMACEPEGGEN